jgi:rRNA-processing protein CGR1
MERAKETNCVMDLSSIISLLTPCPSRSHLQAGVKTKNWQDRMEKTQKALSIRKLQAELREEKQAELKRLVNTSCSDTRMFLIFIYSLLRRREVTAERKRAAEEKRRLEEAKAQVCTFIVP